MDNGYFVRPCDDNLIIGDLEKIQQVYTQIADETSKRIYINRIAYSLTLDVQYIRNVILCTQAGKEFGCKLDELGRRPIWIYGAGKRGKQLVDIFPDKNWVGYIDKQAKGEFRRLRIDSLEKCAGFEDSAIVISNQYGYQEIKRELIQKGIQASNILILEEWNSNAAQNQYFEARCISKQVGMNGFVDAGCFDGTDSLRFAQWVGNKDCNIWAFEPDRIQYDICKLNLAPLQHAKVYSSALSDRSGKAKMTMGHLGGSHIECREGISETSEIITTTMDVLLSMANVGYIKMDLEGHEMSALRGAEAIIRDQRPLLAISLYHKRTDVFKIPSLLLDYNPDYRFSLGHYSVVQTDTVLYAF